MGLGLNLEKSGTTIFFSSSTSAPACEAYVSAPVVDAFDAASTIFY